jgi:hypothetical protein
MKKKRHFVKNKIQIMQHALKMQSISLFPKYTKLISWDFFYVHSHM